MIVALLTFVAASILVDLPVEHVARADPGAVPRRLLLRPARACWSACAPSSSTTCRFYQTFVLQPLIFLGGVFYSATLLPEPFRDAHAVQPRLLHDRARPLRLPRLQRDATSRSRSLFLTVAAAALFAAEPAAVQTRLPPARVAGARRGGRRRGPVSRRRPRRARAAGCRCRAGARRPAASLQPSDSRPAPWSTPPALMT